MLYGSFQALLKPLGVFLIQSSLRLFDSFCTVLCEFGSKYLFAWLDALTKLLTSKKGQLPKKVKDSNRMMECQKSFPYPYAYVTLNSYLLLFDT